MKEKPILFSPPMVRALLAGRKTQTRRLVKPPLPSGGQEHIFSPRPEWGGKWFFRDAYYADESHPYIGNFVQCPYGQVGDRLWVKETHRFPSEKNPRVRVDYRADMSSWGIADSHNIATNEVILNAKLFPGRANEYSKQHWKPSIYMPRLASRLTLEITSVRVERLNDISNSDCWAEGMSDETNPESKCNRLWYSELWESINGPGSWAENPWVWVIEFRRVGA